MKTSQRSEIGLWLWLFLGAIGICALVPGEVEAQVQNVLCVDPNARGVTGPACAPNVGIFMDCFDGGFDTIQCALNFANPGDVILINQGVYPGGNVVPAGVNGLQIKGIGSVVVNCNGAARALTVFGGTLVEGLEFRNCTGTALTDSPPVGIGFTTIDNCRFLNNGTGLDLQGTFNVVRNSLFVASDAAGIGAFRLWNNQNSTVRNNTFVNNVASGAVNLPWDSNIAVIGNLFFNNSGSVNATNGVAQGTFVNFNDYVQSPVPAANLPIGPNDLTNVPPNFVDPINSVYLLQPLVNNQLNPLLNAGPRVNNQTTNIGAYGAGVGVGFAGGNRFAGWITSPDRGVTVPWVNVTATSVPVRTNGNGNLQLGIGIPSGWVRSPVFNLNNLVGDGLRFKTIRAVNVAALENNLPLTPPFGFNVIDIDDQNNFTLTGQNPLADNPVIAAGILNSPTRSREYHIRVSNTSNPCFQAIAAAPAFQPVFNGTKFTRDSGTPNARSVACVQIEFLLTQSGP